MSLYSVASTILYLINSVFVPVLFAVAFLVFLYGVADAYVFSKGEPAAVAKGHKIILWGVIGFVAMISLWGLVNVVANTFGLAGAGAPPLPSAALYTPGAVNPALFNTNNGQTTNYVECPKDANGNCI